MNIGIILYSYSGNTLSVGERLKVELEKKGHEVHLERIRAVNEDPNNRVPVQLSNSPDLSQYDEIILGAPVNAFSLNPIMKTYLLNQPSLENKKISCFVTQHFAKPWMGGNRAVKQISKLVYNKNGSVVRSDIINWSNVKREEQISCLISRFSS